MYTDQKCGQKIPAWWHPCFDEATNKSVNLAGMGKGLRAGKFTCGLQHSRPTSCLNAGPSHARFPAWPKARLRPLRRCVVSSAGSGGTERLHGADSKKP